MTPGPLAHTHFAIEVLAILAFALAGLIEGARRQLDVVGLFASAGLTAFGGGTLRDVLLDRRPFFWVAEVEMLWLVIALCAVSLVLLRLGRLHVGDKAIQLADALGLGLFVASGVQSALVAQLPVVVAVMMGVVTGVFGGVMRDIACNEMPTAFADHRPYAVCGFMGGWMYIFGEWLDWAGWVVALASIATTTGLRLLALKFDWRLPDWRNG